MDEFQMRRIDSMEIPPLPFDIEESINQLRTNLTFCGDQQKVIMVTSSIPGEGKSFISMHLWKMIASLGFKTLLVDCDLRNSEICKKYQIELPEPKMGVTQFLSGQCALEEAIYETPLSMGFLLPVAKPILNPSILLESDRFQAMFDAIRSDYDYIIVDTPPVQVVADTLNISKSCDGTLLVIQAQQTPRKLIANTISSLKLPGTPMLGVVLNRFTLKEHRKGYYSRYYRYGYGYGVEVGETAPVPAPLLADSLSVIEPAPLADSSPLHSSGTSGDLSQSNDAGKITAPAAEEETISLSAQPETGSTELMEDEEAAPVTEEPLLSDSEKAAVDTDGPLIQRAAEEQTVLASAADLKDINASPAMDDMAGDSEPEPMVLPSKEISSLPTEEADPSVPLPSTQLASGEQKEESSLQPIVPDTAAGSDQQERDSHSLTSPAAALEQPLQDSTPTQELDSAYPPVVCQEPFVLFDTSSDTEGDPKQNRRSQESKQNPPIQDTFTLKIKDITWEETDEVKFASPHPKETVLPAPSHHALNPELKRSRRWSKKGDSAVRS